MLLIVLAISSDLYYIYTFCQALHDKDAWHPTRACLAFNEGK